MYVVYSRINALSIPSSEDVNKGFFHIRYLSPLDLSPRDLSPRDIKAYFRNIWIQIHCETKDECKSIDMLMI